MRLIDTDNLRDFMVEHAERIQYAIEHKDGEILESLINQIPIAYDVDKVVEQLEDRSTLSRPVGWSKSYEIVTLEDAIEIVKGEK
ncbi:hypothetical protein [uncultured Eubacterium sp.]|uniref:hypothetical protein n=1 Tax=uncultured Eubacterium sp. TaxID=165185 RepID=UPI0026DACA2D|nr:hypothetical protein [uncultured Eubacterium sp.]